MRTDRRYIHRLSGPWTLRHCNMKRSFQAVARFRFLKTVGKTVSQETEIRLSVMLRPQSKQLLHRSRSIRRKRRRRDPSLRLKMTTRTPTSVGRYLRNSL